MFEVKGKYNTAKVFSDSYDEKTVGQIINLCNQDFTIGAQIRIMPDYHYGAGCTIGFTANLGNKVIPNLVGVDVGCSVLCVNLGKQNIDTHRFDTIVKKFIPAGFESHKTRQVKFDKIKELKCYRDLKSDIFERQIGTLGGGNHFIELDKDDEDNIYLVIHSGSRNMGKQVVDYYQKRAVESLKGMGDFNIVKNNLISELKSSGKKEQIASEIEKLKEKFDKANPSYPQDLCFLEGVGRDDYLHDMKICQNYASLNRLTMAQFIMENYFDSLMLSSPVNVEHFETVHNYINFDDNIIRKGAVSAREGERLIIPINMRDGSLLCTGKGNADWNFSAPHGAGRLMSRGEAKRQFTLNEFKKSMEGIYSTSVSQSTLDEAPMVYKSMKEITDNIGDTATVDKVIKPIYNFKAGGD